LNRLKTIGTLWRSDRFFRARIRRQKDVKIVMAAIPADDILPLVGKM
jgi:hypothetical protein